MDIVGVYSYFCKLNSLNRKNMNTDITTFISKYREAFGEKPELPIVFYYSDTPAGTNGKTGGCFFKCLYAAREGQPISLNAETIGCGGGKLYTGFAPMPPHVPSFVSEKERYKASPADVTECIDKLDIRLTTRKYLNFVRIDKAESLDMIEGLLFIVTPDILSGLAAWAFFDNNSDSAVSCPFGSGCSSVVAQAVRENRLGGRRTFIGMLDPSARPYIGADELSFVIPAVRLPEMLDTIDQCCLSGTHGWTKIKERINGRME